MCVCRGRSGSACACGDSGSITPTPPLYTVGGTVTGLTGSGLILQSSGVSLPIDSREAFTFGTPLLSGTAYAVGVETQPTNPTQICTTTNGSGTVAAANVTNVLVTCEAGYTVGGTVSGLVGSGLVIQISAPGYGGRPRSVSDSLQIDSDGTFTFDLVYPGNTSDGTFVSHKEAACLAHSALRGQQRSNQKYRLQMSRTSPWCAHSSPTSPTPGTTLSLRIRWTLPAVRSWRLVSRSRRVASPHAIVGTQDKRFVFVGNEGSNDISAFSVDTATGALTVVPGSPFAAGIDPKALALYQGVGTYLYAANAGSNTVSAFAVDTSSGSLTPLSSATFATGKGPSSIVVDLNGQFIYVANNGGSNDVSAFAVDPETGILTPVAGSPFPAAASPLSLALGQTGKFLFTANPDAANSSISGFSIDAKSGALTPLSGSPFPLAVSHHIATDVTGAYLYVTAGGGVIGYAIDATTGLLTPLPGFPVVTGTDAYSITLDSNSQFLYVANNGSANVSGFRFYASTGGLTAVSGAPFAAGNLPGFIATF